MSLGSTDGRNWDILRQHEDDTTLNSGYAVGFWKVNGIVKTYRFLRMRQTGLNSSGTHALRMCGFEVYGQLVISE